MRTADLQLAMGRYLEILSALARRYDGTTRHGSEMEEYIDDYSNFVTDEHNREAWAELEQEGAADFLHLVATLRSQSARCAAIMEKYRALNLLDGRTESPGYFNNVESCIEREFGTFPLAPSSKVLLVGSGSFPMTPLHIAERTGARVVGVDIDAEAVELGRRVLKVLGSGFDIRLENVPVEDLPFTGEASHIIFSSTVEAKYDLLHAIHSLTSNEVAVAMRYGNNLKSLFNYPMEEVDRSKWRLVEIVLRPKHVFDVALYVKV